MPNLKSKDQVRFEEQYVAGDPSARFWGSSENPNRVSLPCNCDDLEGTHWAAVRFTLEAMIDFWQEEIDRAKTDNNNEGDGE